MTVLLHCVALRACHLFIAGNCTAILSTVCMTLWLSSQTREYGLQGLPAPAAYAQAHVIASEHAVHWALAPAACMSFEGFHLHRGGASNRFICTVCMWLGVQPTLLLRARAYNLSALGALCAGVQPRVPIPSMYCTMLLGLIGGTLLAHQQSWGVHFLPKLCKECVKTAACRIGPYFRASQAARPCKDSELCALLSCPVQAQAYHFCFIGCLHVHHWLIQGSPRLCCSLAQ